MEPPDKALSAPPTPIAQAALTMYLVEASVRPEILRTGQAVLPLEPSSTHAIGLPGGGSVQMVVTGGRRHGRRAGGGGASAGQGLFPVVDQLPEGQGGYWGSHLTTPQVRPCSLRDTAHPSPGPPPPITLMPHPPLHYQPCPLESLKDPIFRGSLGGPPQHTHTHSLEDPALLQAVFATIPHGGVVHSLNGPVNGLEDILLQALWGAGVGS